MSDTCFYFQNASKIKKIEFEEVRYYCPKTCFRFAFWGKALEIGIWNEKQC